MSDSDNSQQVCVVVGASHAGSQLAVQLRKEGWAGRIILIGAETQLPYHRPPLSKAVLAGEKSVDEIALRPRSMYTASAVELRLGERVESLDVQKKSLLLSTGEKIAYDKLALCTGARVRRLGLGDDLEGVHYLRTADDVASLKPELIAGRRAVIIGGGYIGLETAAVLTQLGLEVTILEAAERLLQRVTSVVMSEYFQRLHEAHGVRIVTHAHVRRIAGDDGRACAVVCADGTEFAADLVIVGVGVIPETSLAEAAGLEVVNGIKVDEYARTTAADVYAAGDCTWHPCALYGHHVRLESVQNALDQSRVAAANIAGKQIAYEALPWFWSDQYAVKLQSAGLLSGYDDMLVRGDRSNRDGTGFSVFYFREGKMIAADCVNRAKEFIACKRLIAERLDVNRQALLDEATAPDTFASV
ncbi:MAG: FAD/NAD(P)-binding oxidoreductase [Gammaproteobacteria bacterium]|nr:FAD/NAD(P)-binding oxidoreductase [Gammaproteobacteria bacterium]